MENKFLLLPILGALALFSCGQQKNQRLVIKKMNFDGAKSLFLGNVKNANSLDGTSKLYKIKEDGTVEEVRLTWVNEETGKEETQIRPVKPIYIKKFNKDYVFVCFNNSPQAEDDTWNDINYLVNISTGDAYKYSKSVPDKFYLDTHPIEDCFPTDKNNNIYVLSCEYKSGTYEYEFPIKKLDISDMNNITMSNASVKGDEVNNGLFTVNDDGYLFYKGERRESAGTPNIVYRCVNPSGGFKDIDEFSWAFKGFDGNAYACKYCHGYDYSYAIFRLNSDGTSTRMGEGGLPDIYSLNCTIYLKDTGKIFNTTNNYLTEIYDNGNFNYNYYDLSKLGIKTYKFCFSSSRYIYFCGLNSSNEDVVVTFDSLDNTSTCVPVENYSLYKMTVDDNELISFNGLRKSDGAIVVGTINQSGEVKESSAVLDKQVEYLEHL